MNNPVRASIQRYYEAPLLKRLGGLTMGQRVLEIGCGRGVGTEIILRQFAAARVSAFDLDPDMVRRARERLAKIPSDQLTLTTGDATQIQFDDASFDAVFDFGIIHHVPDWQKAVSEIARVLKPNGRFYFEEVTRHALERWLYRKFLVHPKENRFTGPEFVAQLEKQGLRVDNKFVLRFFGDFVFGVAEKRLE